MNILIFTDCMSIGPEFFGEDEKYPAIVRSHLIKKLNSEIVIELFTSSGDTTSEAFNMLKHIKEKNKKYDVIIFGYGINDALPRGLKRSTRGKIIQAMYKVNLNDKQRLFARSYFLNPLEYLMQLLRKPLHYNNLDTFLSNTLEILNELEKYKGQELIYISLNPVLNYRFINSGKYIKEYNDRIIEKLRETDVKYIDVYKLFNTENVSKMLSQDKFHYSQAGHMKVAQSIISLIENMESK